MKIVLTIVGCIAVILGVLGIFLPLLPTTPFLLLASACFVRSSPRLYNKLMGSPLGAYVRAYAEGHGIPRHAKLIMLALLWLSLSYSFIQVDHVALKMLLAGVGIAGSFFIIRIRSSSSQMSAAPQKTQPKE